MRALLTQQEAFVEHRAPPNETHPARITVATVQQLHLARQQDAEPLARRALLGDPVPCRELADLAVSAEHVKLFTAECGVSTTRRIAG